MQRGVNLTDTEVYLLVLSVPVCGIAEYVRAAFVLDFVAGCGVGEPALY